MQGKKLIILSYYWPPASGPGVQRILKFVKYLHQFNWDITVICPQNGGYPYTDATLLKDVPSSIKVIHTKSLDPFRAYNFLKGKKGKSIPVSVINDAPKSRGIDKLLFWIRANIFIPDARIGWNPYAYKAASNIVSEDSIVITTGPPHSTHLIGVKLKNNFPQIKHLCDFRDPWTKIYLNELLPRSERSVQKDQELEKKVLKSADHVVVVAQQMKRDFLNYTSKITCIPNGFDENDVRIKDDCFESSDFVLAYVGNFKANQNVPALWEAIAELMAENSLFKKHFQLKLVGRVAELVKSNLADLKLLENVDFKGFVKHREAVDLMKYSNCLLFVVPQSQNNKGIITGKIFEYLAVKVPLLNIGPLDGDASKIIAECNRENMLNYKAKDAIKASLMAIFNQWYNNQKSTLRIQDDTYLKYSRAKLSEQLHELLINL